MIRLCKLEKPDILKQNEIKWKNDLESENPKDHFKRRYNHKDIKAALIKETSQKCAYCESKILHIGFGHIEHILPQKDFVDKTFEWENLTLACEKCNINKGHYYDESYPILNPYTDTIKEHIDIAGPMIISKSYRGTISIEKLKLNRVELIERRKEAIEDFNRIQVNYNEEKNEIIKAMYYQQLEDYLNHNIEYYGTLSTITTLVEVC